MIGSIIHTWGWLTLRTRRFLTSGDSSRIAAIDRVVKESTNVVDEEWIEEFGNLLLVGEFKGTFEWNPIYRW
jgi:hypothetical protein